MQKIDPIRTGPNEYACPFCNKVMKRRAHIVNHILTHTGEKPFQCPYCPWSCNQKHQLPLHIRKKHTEHSVFKTEPGTF